MTEQAGGFGGDPFAGGPPPPPPGASGYPPPPGAYPGGQYGGGAYIGSQKRIGLQILVGILTCGIYGVYWAYQSHEDVKRHSGEGIGGVAGAVIYALVGVVTLFLLPLEIKQMYERDGRESPVSAATAFWILAFGIPWYVKCQAALNDYWASKGAPPATGI